MNDVSFLKQSTFASATVLNGGEYRTRTDDPLRARQVL